MYGLFVFSWFVLCLVTLRNAAQCYAVLCYAMLCDAMLCYVMLCYAMLWYTTLCYVIMPYNAMQCYEVAYHDETCCGVVGARIFADPLLGSALSEKAQGPVRILRIHKLRISYERKLGPSRWLVARIVSALLLYYTILHYTILYYTILYYAMLY